MNPNEFDALVYNNQGFNTMDNLVNSAATTQMSQQTLQSIQTMQTPMPQGHIPQHVVLPVFNNQPKTNPVQQLQFFVVLNGTQKGPFTLEQLKGLVIAEVIDENTQVWQSGTPSWTDLKTCLTNLKL